jgi:hypothetical protein
MSDRLTKHFLDTATVWTTSEHSDDSFLLLAKRIVAHDKNRLKKINGQMFKRLNLLIAIAKGEPKKKKILFTRYSKAFHIGRFFTPTANYPLIPTLRGRVSGSATFYNVIIKILV